VPLNVGAEQLEAVAHGTEQTAEERAGIGKDFLEDPLTALESSDDHRTVGHLGGPFQGQFQGFVFERSPPVAPRAALQGDALGRVSRR
jgi:hypothetical protein